jgi:hypothetical protein
MKIQVNGYYRDIVFQLVMIKYPLRKDASFRINNVLI